MKLKEYISQSIVDNPFTLNSNDLEKLIELEGIENYFNAMYSIEFDIEVIPVEPRGGRWFDKSIVNKIKPLQERVNRLKK